MAGDDNPGAPPLSGRPAAIAVTLVVVSLVGGSVWGWFYAGPLGGLLGVLIGTAVGAVAFTIVRATANANSFDERPAPDVRELPPDQAMQVLTALMNASAGDSRSAPILDGGLLGEIAKAKAKAKAGDLPGALAHLRELGLAHPRSPAVPAEVARLLASHEPGEDADASEAGAVRSQQIEAASQAIELALPGGMFRLATQVYTELDEPGREALQLAPGSWGQLGKIFATRGDEDLAASCRARAESP